MRTMPRQAAHERSRDRAAPPAKTLVITPHPDSLPAKPGPPEAFDDDLAPEDWADALPWGDRTTTGRDSNIVNLVFHSRCAGYRKRPTSRALYDGMRATTPTEEQAHAIRTWLDLCDGRATLVRLGRTRLQLANARQRHVATQGSLTRRRCER